MHFGITKQMKPVFIKSAKICKLMKKSAFLYIANLPIIIGIKVNIKVQIPNIVFPVKNSCAANVISEIEYKMKTLVKNNVARAIIFVLFSFL